MDIQLKKGFLEFCVLASLKNKDSYGYQIIKDVQECIDITESTLYPILKRLEANGYVTTYAVEHNSRLRKYYHITDEGVEHIQTFLNDWNQIEKIYDFVKGEIENDKK